jgi:hypothetical protein
LLRYRRKLVESQAAERNRLLKLLETANIKLASVASDVFGVSGRAMLKALIAGGASAEEMADLAQAGRNRKAHGPDNSVWTETRSRPRLLPTIADLTESLRPIQRMQRRLAGIIPTTCGCGPHFTSTVAFAPRDMSPMCRAGVIATILGLTPSFWHFQFEP